MIITKRSVLLISMCCMVLCMMCSGAMALSTKVMAHYYAWYSNKSFEGYWTHWQENDHNPNVDDISAAFWPATGAFSAKDPQVLQQDMKGLRDAGIGTIICSWTNNYDDENLAALPVLNAAAPYGIKVCFLLEPYACTTAQQMIDGAKYIIDTYGSHPAFYRESGKPLFLVYNSGNYSASEWAAAIDPLDGTGYESTFLAEYLSSSTTHSLVLNGHFDGIFTYAPNSSTNPNTWASEVTWANSNNKMFLPGVSPGYDDRQVRSPNSYVLRNGGTFYNTNWSKAVSSGATYAAVISWNEWHEGTQIAPAVPKTIDTRTYQDYTPDIPTCYVDQTNSWAAIFDSGNSGVIQCENYSGGTSAVEGTDYHDTTTGNAGGQYRSQNVDIYTCAEGGYYVGSTVAGEWLRYTGISIPTAGDYDIRARVACSSSGGSLRICDGSTSNTILTLSVPSTSSRWQTISGTATLSAGTHTIYLAVDNVGFDMNWFEIRPHIVDAVIPTVDTITFDPAPGTYNTPTWLSMATTTPGATIRYTTDGTNPRMNTLGVYTTPRMISNSTFKARAWAPGYMPSPITTGTYAYVSPETWDWGFSTFESTLNDISLIDSAAYANDVYSGNRGCIRVSPSTTDVMGSAWYVNKVNVSNGDAGFATEFWFSIDDVKSGGADGLSFVMQNTGNFAAQGYYNGSVSVKFDTYQNTGDLSDNSVKITGYGKNQWENIACDLTPLGIMLKDSSPHLARIEYAYKNMTVILDGVRVLSMPIDLYAFDGCDASGNAWIGFEANSGAVCENHDVLEWHFKSNFTSVAIPSIHPGGSIYDYAPNVVITDATDGATIHYTTDGTAPTEASPVYTAPISVSSSATLKAFAVKSGMPSSGVSSESYVIQSPERWDFAYSPDFTGYTNLNLGYHAVVMNDPATTGSENWVRMNTTDPGSAGTAWRSTKMLCVNGFTTQFHFLINNIIGSGADGFSFNVQNNSSWAGGWAYGSGDNSLSIRFDTAQGGDGEISGEFVGIRNGNTTVLMQDVAGLGINFEDGKLHVARIEYTADGKLSVYVDGILVVDNFEITLAACNAIDANGNAWVGFLSSNPNAAVGETPWLKDWKFRYQHSTTPPVFQPDGSIYDYPQSVSLVAPYVDGAVIRYTTDGSTPTATSAIYSSPIAVNSNTTIKAITTKAGMPDSVMSTANYVIQSPEVWDFAYKPDFTGYTNLNIGYNSAVLNSPSITGDQTWLRLNPAVANQSGMAWHSVKVPCAGGFTTQLHFMITDASTGGSQGFAFNVQNNGPWAGGWAYGSGVNSLSIRFDTYQNEGEPSGSFIGVRNGNTDVTMQDVTTFGVNYDDGRMHVARIEYTADGKLTIYIDGHLAVNNYAISLSSCNAVDANGYAWVGYTSNTAGIYEAYWLKDWAFRYVHTATDVNKITDLHDGDYVRLIGKSAMCAGTTFTDGFFVEEPLRNCGIKVVAGSGSGVESVLKGDTVTVTGTVSTGSDNKLYINASTISRAGGTINPLGMNNRALSSVDRLLTRIWGKVSHIDSSKTFFYVNDGSNLSDGGNYAGVKVDCSMLTSPNPVTSIVSGLTEGQFVVVTGVVVNTNGVPTIRPREAADIQ
ncbi:MAG: chitobiase/beta-hexosaminidase C-terminal domain-containing protein [Armatimonadota bacterium]